MAYLLRNFSRAWGGGAAPQMIVPAVGANTKAKHQPIICFIARTLTQNGERSLREGLGGAFCPNGHGEARLQTPLPNLSHRDPPATIPKGVASA